MKQKRKRAYKKPAKNRKQQQNLQTIVNAVATVSVVGILAYTLLRNYNK